VPGVLQVHLADHPLDLLPLLVDGLSEPTDDVFAADWVVVPSLGVRAWLSRELSERLGATGEGGHDGVAANIRFPFPGSLRWTVLGAASGSADDVDPWQEERLVWSVLEVLRDPPAGLDKRLVDAESGVALAARAQAVATLFDTYNVHRPAMVGAWVDGRDVDASGAPLADPDLWQPELFRLVHDRIRSRFGVDDLPSVRLERALEAVRSGDAEARAALREQVPDRLFVFGQSIWSGETGPVLTALAVDRGVQAFVPSPSAAVSFRLAAASPALAGGTSLSWSSPRAPLVGVEHPLLASWGVRPLETALLLGAGGVEPTVVAGDGRGETSSLLGRVQSELRSGEPGAPEPAGLDRSLQIHGAPGRTRQVEVLRDVILDLLDRGAVDGSPLVEADIAVVCHRLDEFAPLIGAVWGPSSDAPHVAGTADTPTLRYSLIDRSARTVNPVLDALAALLDVVPGRMDRDAVRDLLSMRAVRERFGLGTDDLDLLDDWVEGAGIRWGLDGRHREQGWNLPSSYEVHTWATGIGQLAAGVAGGEPLRLAPLPGTDDPPVGEFDLSVGAAAIAAVADGRIEGATRLVDALCSLVEVRELLVGEDDRPIDEWVRVLRATADRFLATERFADWQRLTLDRSLEKLVESSGTDGSPSDARLGLSDLRRLLGPVLQGSPSRTKLGVGGISIARPSQLAGVPYRVVCVLGLDGDALPVGGRSGDDIGARSPLVGDRDVRTEARAELLSVLTSATDAVVVTFASHDVRTNAEVPRAAVLDELLDAVGEVAGVTADDLVVLHPRQAFDPANFVDDAVARRPQSFDARAARAASVLAAREVAEEGAVRNAPVTGVLVPAPLDVLVPAAVELEDLRRFHRSPVERFLRTVLAVSAPRRSSSGVSDAAELPLAMSRLDESELGRRLVDVARVAGTADVLRSEDPATLSPTVEQVVESFRARGVLPPPALASSSVISVAEAAAGVYEAVAGSGYLGGALHDIQIDVDLEGRWVSGVVQGCTLAGGDDEPGPVVVRYTRPKGHLRLATCLDLLALTAQHPDVRWRALLVTRPTSDVEKKGVAAAEVSTYRVRGESADERRTSAVAALGVLLEQYDRGHRSPLPLFPETSSAYQLRGRKEAAKIWGDPRSSWTKEWSESLDPANQLAFGERDFGELMALRAAGTSFEDEADSTWGTLAAVIDGLVEGDGS
jgi:exodeoxyribonuclease V gamma subunit